MPIKKVHWQEYPSAKITHCGQRFEKVHWSPEAERVTCKKCLNHISRVKTGMVPDLRALDDADSVHLRKRLNEDGSSTTDCGITVTEHHIGRTVEEITCSVCRLAANLKFKKKPVPGKTNKPKKDKVRINMDVEPKTKERLDNLVVMLEASGYTEVVRRALIFFEREMEKCYGRPNCR